MKVELCNWSLQNSFWLCFIKRAVTFWRVRKRARSTVCWPIHKDGRIYSFVCGTSMIPYGNRALQTQQTQAPSSDYHAALYDSVCFILRQKAWPHPYSLSLKDQWFSSYAQLFPAPVLWVRLEIAQNFSSHFWWRQCLSGENCSVFVW